jgi:hypothetical protein
MTMRSVSNETRFRAEFDLYTGIWIMLGFIALCTLSIASLRMPLEEGCMLTCAVIAVVTNRTTWWTTSPKGLRHRILWQRQLIPWAEITRVSNNSFWGGFTVHYRMPASGRSSRKLTATPADREGFLTDLKRHAPDAEFEI